MLLMNGLLLQGELFHLLLSNLQCELAEVLEPEIIKPNTIITFYYNSFVETYSEKATALLKQEPRFTNLCHMDLYLI